MGRPSSPPAQLRPLRLPPALRSASLPLAERPGMNRGTESPSPCATAAARGPSSRAAGPSAPSSSSQTPALGTGCSSAQAPFLPRPPGSVPRDPTRSPVRGSPVSLVLRVPGFSPPGVYPQHQGRRTGSRRWRLSDPALCPQPWAGPGTQGQSHDRWSGASAVDGNGGPARGAAAGRRGESQPSQPRGWERGQTCPGRQLAFRLISERCKAL